MWALNTIQRTSSGDVLYISKFLEQENASKGTTMYFEIQENFAIVLPVTKPTLKEGPIRSPRRSSSALR